MSERSASQVYGVRVGLVSGLFSIGQVALSAAAAHGSEADLRAIQRAFSILSSGGIADPTVLITPLVPMLATTYLSLLAIGLLTLWFAAQAGRLAATAEGRHVGGASAGMWVWLVSTLIWLAASVVTTVGTHTDGTISGIFAGTFNADFLPQELIFLLLQEVFAALISLGFCALAGAYGARHARLVAPVTPPMAPGRPLGYPPQGAYPYAYYPYPGSPAYPPRPGQYPGVYPPQQPYPGYPAYPADGQSSVGALPPPSQSPLPPAGAPQSFGSLPYPPPPSFYMPQQAPQTTPTPAQAPTQVDSPSASLSTQPE